MDIENKTIGFAYYFAIETRPLLFARYVFVVIGLQWHAIEEISGVSRVVRNDGGPARVPDAVIDEIRSRLDSDGVIALQPKINGHRWRRGGRLRILSGCFEGRDAIFVGEAAQARRADEVLMYFAT